MIKLLLACIIPLAGFSFEHIKPETAQKEDPSILFKLKGILFLNNWNLVRSDPIDEVEGVAVKGVQVLSQNPGFLRSLQEQFVGQPLTPAVIRTIKQMVADFYEANNQPFVRVNVPKQELMSGVLQLVVTEAVLGEIRCKGNTYFLSEDLKGYIRSKPGQVIDPQDLMKDLAFMNHNPFRRTDGMLRPGKTAGLVDLELLTVDRWPYRIYVGADNTGTIATQRNRIFFGLNLGKTVVQDSEISYQYTTAPNGNRYFSHTGMVRVPLPWMRHILQVFGAYAGVKPEKVGSWKAQGISWDASIRYRIPIFQGLVMLQEAILGYDFKQEGAHAHTSGRHPRAGQADVSQFMAGYNLGVRDRLRQITLNLELFASPSHMSSQDNEAFYNSVSKGANPQYAYLKAVHSFLQEIPSGWRFSYNISGQLASTNLMPSEQMTLTGFNGVRGFEERIVNVDNGVLLNITVEAPHFSPAYWMGWCKHYDDLCFLAFFDMAAGRDHQVTGSESSCQSLGSVGPGLRYTLSHYASAHLDYGFQLWHGGFNPITDSRYNFGITLSY